MTWRDSGARGFVVNLDFFLRAGFKRDALVVVICCGFEKVLIMLGLLEFEYALYGYWPTMVVLFECEAVALGSAFRCWTCKAVADFIIMGLLSVATESIEFIIEPSDECFLTCRDESCYPGTW